MKLFAILMCRISVVAFVTLSFGAAAQETLYRVNSKDVGWNTIDLTIAETQRTARTSELKIPRYNNRTSVEARFAMCAFTDLAFQRGFGVWIVVDYFLIAGVTRDKNMVAARQIKSSMT